MGMPVVIYGKSGSGKSRSLKEFGEDEILLIQCIQKEMPFRKKFSKVMPISGKPEEIDKAFGRIKAAMMKAVNIGVKSIVIDDSGYLMTNIFMAKHRNLKGNASFELYNDIGDVYFNLVNAINELPDGVIVYLILLDEMDDYGNIKLKTLGKLLDQKVCIEGMVTVCLRCITDGSEHYFITKSDGADLSKSPEEMFETKEIPNDLKAVDTTIREYYGWTDKKEEKK